MLDIPPNMVKRIEQGRIIIEGLIGGPTEVIVQAMEQCKADFLGELDGLNSEQIDYKPAEDRWSIREVALHVSNAMRNVGELSAMLGDGQLRGEKPELKPNMFDEDPGEWEAVLNLVAQGFDASIDAARNVDSISTPDDTLDHPWFGPFNCRQWAAFNVIHCKVHVAQLSKNKDAEGYPA